MAAASMTIDALNVHGSSMTGTGSGQWQTHYLVAA
jgi:hypothetical protein